MRQSCDLLFAAPHRKNHTKFKLPVRSPHTLLLKGKIR
jgi:hypothetical protein